MDGPVECFPIGVSRRKPKFLSILKGSFMASHHRKLYVAFGYALTAVPIPPPQTQLLPGKMHAIQILKYIAGDFQKSIRYYFAFIQVGERKERRSFLSKE